MKPMKIYFHTVKTTLYSIKNFLIISSLVHDICYATICNNCPNL